MNDKTLKKKTAEVVHIKKDQGPETVAAGHYRMLPLDNRKVTQLFSAHDRFREISRAV